MNKRTVCAKGCCSYMYIHRHRYIESLQHTGINWRLSISKYLSSQQSYRDRMMVWHAAKHSLGLSSSSTITRRQHQYWKHHHHHWFDSPTWALAFLRSLCQLKYPAIASSDFVTRVFSRVGFSAPCPTPDYPGGPMFSVKVDSLSWLVLILKRQDLAFCPCMTYPYERCPGATTLTCMQWTW
jgi:hypothetical protein